MSTTYTFEQLKEDVRKEAEALKIHATKEERERLDVETYNPVCTDTDLYGQLTGNCYSKRARLLKEKTSPTKPKSSIEAYTSLPEANNANLISFLRGETETPTL
jgi:hypothetical protein